MSDAGLKALEDKLRNLMFPFNPVAFDLDAYIEETLEFVKECLAAPTPVDAEIADLKAQLADLKKAYLAVADAVAKESYSPADLALRARRTRASLKDARDNIKQYEAYMGSQSKKLLGAREALALRIRDHRCPECENYLEAGLKHKKDCKFYAVETALEGRET